VQGGCVWACQRHRAQKSGDFFSPHSPAPLPHENCLQQSAAR
jgi:hypothetical protein